MAVATHGPFARAGVGAVATQCYCNTSYGPRGLALLENGASPEQALAILTDGDPQRDYRQVGIIDAQGRSASFTGAHGFDWAGSLQGRHCAEQGNTLAGPGVVQAMVRAFETTPGALALRLMIALQAGQAAGGDRRGQQSAALKVVRAGGGWLQRPLRCPCAALPLSHPQPRHPARPSLRRP